ncbi:MAG: response regulator [Deltaproteobacteria bacterium]|nr:response regulator [Deltaproteobacteria bacterium]
MAQLLVVDDQEVNRYLLEVLLKGHGHAVTSASNGVEALALARKSPPEVVITDILMPEMDGFALCRAWQKDPALAPIPLIFYTATYTDPKDEKFALSLGAARFIVKPTEPDRFISILDQVLKDHREGKLGPAATPVEEEDVFLKEYNQTLIHKLEQKIMQLEQTNKLLLQEVEDRKKAERELSRSEEQYRTLMEAVADPVIVYDLEERVLFLNRAFNQVFGWTLAELKNQTLAFVPPEDVLPFQEVLERVREGEPCCAYENRRLTKDRGLVEVSISAACFRDDLDQPRGVVVSLQDITHKKQAEEERNILRAQLIQAQKMEALGTLAGGIAHDFNNILSPIIGFTELVAQKTADDLQRGRLQIVLDSCQRARDLISQILTFSRRTEPEIVPVTLGPLLKEITKLLKVAAPKDVDISYEAPAGPVKVSGDPSQLHQVLLNLGTNALHALAKSKGRGSLVYQLTLEDMSAENLTSFPELQAGPHALIRVEDTGSGMSPEVLERIFEPFFTTKAKGEGTGLGLSVAHGIITQMGGAMRVSTTEGRGSQFSLYLPLDTSAANREEAPAALVAPRGSEAILVVDDEQAILMLYEQILGELGYRVTKAGSGEEALALVRRQPGEFDLVLTDFAMPDLNGLEVGRALHWLAPDLPIILASGTPEDVSQEQLREGGICYQLPKPCTLHKMAVAIRAVLDEAPPRYPRGENA